MGTITAQILIGEGHPNDGGIRPEYTMQLSENSKLHWNLNNNIKYLAKPPTVAELKKMSYYGWFPSVEHVLEDGLLMIGLHVVKDTNLIKLAQEIYPPMMEETLWVHEIDDKAGLLPSRRQELYDALREIEDWPKLMVSVFMNSALGSHLQVLEELPIDIEICQWTRVRCNKGWSTVDETRSVIASRLATE